MLGSCNATFEEYPELALEIRGGLTRREVGQYGRQLVLPKLGPEGQREISRGQMEQAYTRTHTHTHTSACTPANYQIFRHHQIFQRMSAANNRLQSDQFRRQPPRRKCNSTMAAVVHQHTRFTRSCWAVSSISLLADRVFVSGFWVRDSPLPHVHEHNGNSAD